MEIKIEGIKELIADLEDKAKRQVPYALSRAINKTAQQAVEEIKREMSSYIDRPTPYTIKGLRFKRTTKNDLTSFFGFKDEGSDWAFFTNTFPAAKYMWHQVWGGVRKLKRFEKSLVAAGVLPSDMYIAPGAGCPLDSYGNIPSALIIKILSYFKAYREQGYKSNITDKRKAKLKVGRQTKTRATLGYEYIYSHGKDVTQPLSPGLYYKRTGVGGNRNLLCIFKFVKQPLYKKRFPFYEIGQKAFDKNFNRNFDEALRDALKTAK